MEYGVERKIREASRRLGLIPGIREARRTRIFYQWGTK